MSLKEKIIEAKAGSSTPITFPQGRLLYQLSRLKWWQPETMPPPTVAQASLLIEYCLNYVNNQVGGDELIEGIRIWFPEFDSLDDIRIRYPKKGETPEHIPMPEKESGYKKGFGGKAKTAEPLPETTPEPEHIPEPKQPAPAKPKAKKEAKPVKGTAEIEALINAGLTNIWMVGPAGCGKTTICLEVGELAGIPVTIIPCGAGTSATTFMGYKYPEREGTPFVHAFSQEGIIVLDEFTALEASVAQIANSALANGELTSTIGTFKRHPKCIIIATSNTFGNGADRMYVANNQLDSSTKNRFPCGVIEIDYSKEYERQYDMEVVNYVWKIRDIIKSNGLREICSTRDIIAGCQLKTAGLDWKKALTITWSKDEKALL